MKVENSVEKGFNSDIQVLDRKYHVQTEDWGRANPFLVSRVFKEGAVLKSFKTPYDDVLRHGHRSDIEAIRKALRDQHNEILDRLISGHI